MKIVRLLALSLFLCAQAIAQAPSLNFDPLSVSTSASYGNSKGWFIDAAGNRFVISNNKISKVSPLGQFTVIAGSDIAGFADGTAALAKFSNPVALAADGAGNIYVSDSGNFRIRKITPAGQVSTLAGSGTKGISDGPAALASFYALGDITADSAGNVYVIDQQEIIDQAGTIADGKIRKITPEGNVSVFGPGLATPISLSADRLGNVWTTKYAGTPRKYSSAGNLLQSITPAQHAQTITTDRAGNAYVHVWMKKNLTLGILDDSVFIEKIFPSGRRLRLAGAKSGYTDSIGASARFITGLAEIDADYGGNLYVSEEGHTRKMSAPDLHFVAYGGTASIPQSFSVSGNYLTASATLNAPAGYELSLRETGAYASSLTISPDAGEINVVTVYIRLKAGLTAGTYNGNLLFSSATVNQQLPVSGTAVAVMAQQGTGLQGVYYKGIGLSGAPLLTRIDSSINFELTSLHPPLSPAPGIVPEDSFSVRWTGQVKALFTETYTFSALSDDGIRVWVNGIKLIDTWVNHSSTEKSGTISLVAGQKYNIAIEYFESTGDAVCRLYWSSPNTTKAVVPKSQLYPPSNETESLKGFINSNGSLVPDTAVLRPVITLGTASPKLAGATVSRSDSRIRYLGGHTIENFDNVQPGNYPKNLFTTAKNISFSANERSAIGSIVEFDITCPKFEIFEYENGGGVRVLVDNKVAGAYSYRAIGDLSYRLFDFTAINPNPVLRHIRLEYSDKTVMGGLKLDTVGVLLPLQDAVNYRICWLGDSFTEGTGVASNQALHAGLAAYASKILGFRDYRMSGFGGTGYNASFNPGFTAVRPSLADRINYDGINADVFVIAMGINDSDADTALAGKIKSTLDDLRAKNPASLIFVLGPWGNGNGANIKSTVQNRIIAAAANRPGVKFISVYDIPFSKSDATHPDAAGHVMLGTAVAARIRARVGAADTTVQTPVIGVGKGLKGRYIYYDPNPGTLSDTSTAFLDRTDSTINFEFSNSNLPQVIYPAPDSLLNRGYAVRWTGKLQAQYSEPYTFYTLADDGIRLWVNGILLIDNWMDQHPTEKSKTILLAAGQLYDVKIEYYQHAGNGVAKLYWSSASTPKAIVPKLQLYPEAIGTSLPPSCTSNFSPADAAVISTSTSAKLVWSAGSQVSAGAATSYDLYIWRGATAPASPTASVDSNSYMATGLAPSALYNWYVVPKNASGAAIGCAGSNVTTFITAPNVPGCASNLVPANGTVITTAVTAALSWDTVSTATSYDVFVWPTSGTAPATATANVTTNAYTATGLNSAVSYSWYVVPKNISGTAAGCAVNNTSTFITALPLPACVTNTSPTAGTTLGTQTTATLSWPSSATAISYDVYLSAGAGTPTTLITNTTSLTYTATGLTTGTLYSWYIAPRNANGANTACATTNTTTFTTASVVQQAPCVINTLPANAAVLPSQTSARLNWPASLGAVSYDVYLAAGAGTPTVLRTNTTALTYYATGLTAGTLYSWYVAPRNANGANTSCAATNTTSFTTAVATGGANRPPVANGGTNSSITLPVTTTTLNGTASYDPDGSVIEYYWYQVQGPVTATLSNFSATPTVTGLTTAGNYVFGLQVKDNSGVPSYSSVTVTVNAAGTVTVPACVTNASPAAGTTIATTNTVTLSWPASPNATSYDVYLAAGIGVPTTIATNTTGLSYNATGLTAGTTYSWYIAPRNAVGVNTTCASANTTIFTTASTTLPLASCVTNTSPTAGATVATQNTATLSWAASANATSYDVYLSAGNGTPATLVTNTTALTYNATGLTAGTLYSWWIAPRNASGANTVCAGSNTSSFTTSIPPVPVCVNNTSPAAGTTIATQNSVTLAWPSAATAISYDVYLAAGAGTPTVLVANTIASTLVVTGLTHNTTYSWYVAPRNASGVNTTCAAANATTFTTALTAVPLAACITNISPAAGATIATENTVTLTWPASVNATSYDVYLSAGAGTATTLLANTTALTYTATGLTAGTVYSWYIAPRNAGGVNATCASNNSTLFTTAAAPIPLAACVTNTSPAEGTTLLTQNTATLVWPASANATSYDVYLTAGNGTPAIMVSNTTDLTYSAADLTASTVYSWYIAPRNASGANTACASSNTTTFTTAALPAPACVTNTSPAAGSTLLTQNTATLVWPASLSALSYDVYLAAGSGTPPVLVTNTTDLSYSATGLIAGTVYSWYVAPRNASGANAACAAANTTAFSTAALPVPACVNNTSPAAGTTLLTQNTAILTWSASANATSYDVYLAAGTGTPTVLLANTTDLTYSATGLTAATTYSWWVAPRNAGGANTACASANTSAFTTATPTVPLAACVINALPAAGTVLATQHTATLTWPASPDAISYDVYLAAGTGVPVTLVTNTDALTYNAVGLTANTTYSWYIAPRNAGGANTSCGALNTTMFITAMPPVPACVINTSPAAGAVIATQTTATLNWPASADAISYDVYLSAGSATPTILLANTTALTYDATGLTPGTLYSWYIAPRNTSGANADCATTSTTSFTTAPLPVPACVINTIPVAGATLATQNTATLSWPSSATATSYDVYLATGNGTPTTLLTNTTALTYNATGLTAGTLYSWYIAPRNASGANTSCATTNTTSFTTAAVAIPLAACVTNTSPTAGTTLATQNTATLSWPASANATSYDVYLATGNGTPTTLVTNTTALSYNVTGLTAGTLYSWYIAPRNVSGANTACATTNTTSFTTAAVVIPLATCVTNISPAAGTTLATQNTATLSWPASTTATSYDVYLATGNGTPTILVTNTTALTYNATGLTAGTLYSWYIAPRNASGANTACATTNTTSFTTAPVAIPLAACVTNTSPAAGATLATQNTATLSWPSSATATSYDVYLSAGNSTPTILVTNTTALTYNATGLTAGTLYSWYIAPRNASGANIACATSNATSFTTAAAVLLPPCVINTLPANAAVLPSQTSARLNWPASSGAVSYDVYLAAGAGTPTVLRTNTTALTYYATGLTANTTYSWYVAPRNANGANTACAATNTTSFTTAVATGGANRPPVANGGTNSSITLPVTTTTLNGTASYDPDGSVIEYYWYQVQGPVTAMLSNFSATPTVTGLTTAGNYVFGLQVKDNSGVPSYSSVTVTVNAAGTVTVPACVTNASPAAGTTIATTNTVTLSWPASPNATSYDVYLAAGNAVPTVLVTNTTGLTYTLNNLNANTAYSWYIAPRNTAGVNAGCAASNTTTFTTAAFATPPASCVTNTSPAAGATLATQNTTTLTWPASANATSYDVYLSAGSGIPTTLVTNTTALTYSATGLTPGTVYSWYISPRNAGGANTACATTNTTSFTTAPLPVPACVINTTPVAGATIATQNTATLSWPASATAISYDVYLSAGSGTPTTLVTNTSALTYNATGLTAGSLYSWYIAPRNASGANTACSTTNTTSFTTAAVPIPLATCVTNTSPAAGATIATQNTVTLSWPASADATSYDVYLSAGAGTPTTLVTNTTALTYNATGLTAGTLYSWYVAPRNVNGANTACATTNTTSFTTAAVSIPLASCVINTSPAAGTTLATQTTATLSWPASANAASYDVYLSAGAGTPTTLVTNTTALTYNATGLTAGTLYSWYVAPRNLSGANTACATTNATSFTTAAVSIPLATCVINTSPAAGTTLATQNVATLSWPASATAASYDVYLSTGSGTPTTLVTNTTALTYNATGLTAGTLYSWYVAPRNASGVNTACATTNTTSFSTAAVSIPLAACVTNTSPAAGTTLATQTTATLSWPTSATATSYDVYLSAGAGTPTTLVTNTTALTYNATGLTAGTLYRWYIAPRNSSGANTACATTNTTSFTTAPVSIPLAACVINTSPANAAILPSQTSARLNWPASSGAVSYDVYLAAGAGTPTVLRTNTTALTYYATGLTAGTLYSWYVAPRNANGANTSCSATNTTSFTTAAATGGANRPPVANAGTNSSITLPVTTTTLNGTASYDPDGSVIEYYWYQVQGPVTATLSNFSATPTVTGLTTAGNYVFGLQVKDNNGVPSYSSVTVTVRPAGAALVSDDRSNSRTAAIDELVAGTLTDPPSMTSTMSPNPVKSGQYARLQINSNKTCTATIKLMTGNGINISSQRINLAKGINTTSIQTTALAQGLYFVNITGNDKSITLKLVVE